LQLLQHHQLLFDLKRYTLSQDGVTISTEC
jgi:hypothetical protein